MGIIYIDRLKVYAYHGVFDEEKAEGQNFYVSCKITPCEHLLTNLQDNIDLTVNYAEIVDYINAHMKDHSYNLLESISDSLAKRILDDFPGISKISVRIDKPEAPLPYEFDSVAYEVERAWHPVYISLGSNMGDRVNYLNKAITELSAYYGINLIEQAEIIETEPYGNTEQAHFLNSCIVIETYYTPEELLNILHDIENANGRVRTEHWGPRTLDLDILLYDDWIIHNKDLCIPHIDMQNRSFVLQPLSEIAPYAYHPILHKTAAQLLKELE